MNERLKTHLILWRSEHFHGRRDGDYSGEYLERSSQLELAQHIYSLALEDVRKEVEKIEKVMPYCEDYERGCIEGRNGLREELLDFINNLTSHE